ncbi:MAG: hypothetical protein M5U28_24730 [Sandaracinaceae bacterium]|nr:hypothetical protein [Sandaracinaceae bacterium]
MVRRLAALSMLVLLALPPAARAQRAPFDAAAWRGLLSRYATEDGGFATRRSTPAPPTARRSRGSP